MLTFETFEVGKDYGSEPVTLTPEMFDDWAALFPDDRAIAPEMPEGMSAVLTINAYMKLLSLRPPGNVHGSQRTVMKKLPRLGDTVTTNIRCLSKEMRNGRRWVELETITSAADGEVHFTGTMRVVWAQ